MSMIAEVDTDCFKYACSFAGETRSVLVEHADGFCKEFKSRTEFHGRGKDKNTGEIAKLNKAKGKTYLADEFEYTDIQVAEPLDEVYRSTKNTIDLAITRSGAKSANHYVGSGESWRVDASTLLRYKGERGSQIKPLLLDEVTAFIVDHYNAEIITDLEVDDVVTMKAYGKPDRFVLGEDKDASGAGTKFYNISRPNLGVVDGAVFGSLHKNDKGKVTGVGRMFKMFQTCWGDPVDNYKAGCLSDVRIGEVGVYDRLVGSTNDKELFQNSVNIFKELYPEPKIVTGWRGDKIDVDWLYVMQEMFTMAHMLRFENDSVDIKSVLDKLNVN